MLQTKYLVALVAIILAVLNALQVAVVGGIERAEVAQLVIVGAGALIAIAVPLVPGKWAGLLKTGLSIVIALATALAPLLITGTITLEQWITVILAGVQALAVQIGVSVRTDSVKAAAAVLDDSVPTPGAPFAVVNLNERAAQNAIATLAADPAAAKVVLADAA